MVKASSTAGSSHKAQGSAVPGYFRTSAEVMTSFGVLERCEFILSVSQDQDDTNYAVSPSTPLLSTAIEENGWVSGRP